MDDAAARLMETVSYCIEDLEDPRVQASCDHSLTDILTIALLAVTCGADDWTDIEVSRRVRCNAPCSISAHILPMNLHRCQIIVDRRSAVHRSPDCWRR